MLHPVESMSGSGYSGQDLVVEAVINRKPATKSGLNPTNTTENTSATVSDAYWSKSNIF